MDASGDVQTLRVPVCRVLKEKPKGNQPTAPSFQKCAFGVGIFWGLSNDLGALQVVKEFLPKLAKAFEAKEDVRYKA